jgi:polar amino acid transport system substrate-binding protein
MRNSCVLLGLLASAICAEPARGDTLAEIQKRGTLIWGADAEGGGPYVYPDPANPRAMIGFEAELADALAGELGVTARFFQGPWHELPALLERSRSTSC